MALGIDAQTLKFKIMYLQITSVEIGHDKTEAKVPFKKVGFAPLIFLPNGKQVLAQGRERFRVIFPDAKREVNGVETLIKGDMLFHTAAVGEVVEGQIATFATAAPYTIEGNTNQLTSVTSVAFKGENPAILAANQAGVAVVTEDGEKVAPTKTKTSVAAPL